MKLDKKNILLIGAIIGVALISWQFTIKNTFTYKNEIEALNLEELRKKQSNLERLATKNKFLEKAIQEKNISQSSISEVLFKKSRESNSIQILDYNDDIIQDDKTINQRFYQLSLKGNYNELIQLIDEILLQCPSASLVNFSFEYHKRNYRSKEYLSLDLIYKVNE